MNVKRLRVFYLVSLLTTGVLFPLMFVSSWWAVAYIAYCTILGCAYYTVYTFVQALHGKCDMRSNWENRMLMRLLCNVKEGHLTAGMLRIMYAARVFISVLIVVCVVLRKVHNYGY